MLDYSSLPCVSRSQCPAAPTISNDTLITIQDDNNTLYSCPDDHFLNFSRLNYPASVVSKCSTNQIFNNTLPYWEIEGVEFPISSEDKSLCLSSLNCNNQLPNLPDHLTSTWNGETDVGTNFKYFCEMEGLRGSAKFLTSNIDKTALEAIMEDTKFYQFRSEIKSVMMVIQANSADPVYIYLSQQSGLANNTYCIILKPNLVQLMKISHLWGQYEEQVIEEKNRQPNENDFWIALDASTRLVAGSWDERGEKTSHGVFELDNLASISFIGFSSFSDASWLVQNGNK